MGEMGWEFTENPGTIPDFFFGKRYMHEIYIQSDCPYQKPYLSTPKGLSLRDNRP